MVKHTLREGLASRVGTEVGCESWERREKGGGRDRLIAWETTGLHTTDSPKDSLTGRYDFTTNMGVPKTCDSSKTWPLRLVKTP